MTGMLYLAQQAAIVSASLNNLMADRDISTWTYIGEDTTWRVRTESLLPEEIKQISLSKKLNDAATRLRRPYIDWVGNLAKNNQSEIWWASEIAAKNPYHMLFTRICLLDSAYRILDNLPGENVLIVAGTPALFQEIAAYAVKCGIVWSELEPPSRHTIPKLHKKCYGIARKIGESIPPFMTLGKFSGLYQQLLEKHIVYRKKILHRHGIKATEPFDNKKSVLFFSWIDRRSFAPDGSYTDPNFGPLPTIYKNSGYDVGFVPRVLFTIPFEEAVIKLKKTGENLFFPEHYIEHADLKRFIRQSKDFSPNIPPDTRISGIPVASLAREHIDQTRGLIPENLLYHPMIQRMSANGVSPSVILHTCEGHSWENSLCLAVHSHMKETKILGYDNVTFSRFVLSMYPSKTEFSFKPLPDYIVTNGPLFEDTLISEGYPETRVRCGCALRHTYLWKGNLSNEDSKPHSTKPAVRILVATAIGLGDSVELISKAAKAFGSNQKYELLIKCHPLVRIDDVKKYLGKHLDHKNISFSTASIGELLPEMDLLLYTYTSVCYEAMMHGVYPICVMPENFINLDKLDATPEIRALVNTPEELFECAEKIIASPEDMRVRWKNDARDIVFRALSPVNESCMKAFFP